ncbi:Hypothetical protein NGAL_HAMBI2610_48790 [Neorhizobium galegae bv. orientalis]|nr:Hypothetical protein NGAL_HAMBI2610_48790 [Neorhizobium galegae bv. orientalis]
MVHLMPNPTKSPDGVYYFRMRVPKDLTDKVGKDIYSISLRPKDPRLAKTLFTEMLAAKEREHAALRAGPQAVPYKALVALAGQVYREFIERFANDAHKEDTWISLEGLLARLTGEDSPAHWFGRVADDLLRKPGWNADANSIDKRIPQSQLRKTTRTFGCYNPRQVA